MVSPEKRLVTIRTRLGLSQERMASVLGVSFVSVNRWENGHSTPMRAVLDLYDALEAALRAGRQPAEIVRAAGQERPLFLRRLFMMAYPAGGAR